MNKEKMHRVVEAEYAPVEEQQAEGQVGQEALNLQDVGFMVIVGRMKDGKPFFHSVNLPDFFVAEGLLDYGKRELDKVYRNYFTALEQKGPE